jgi:hypothetical protein
MMTIRQDGYNSKIFFITVNTRTIMKRTIILLAIISAFVIAFVGISQDVSTHQKGGCCDMIFGVFENGNPVENCTVIIQGTTSFCVTGENGECSICVPEELLTAIAEASCSGGQSGQTQFFPCGAADYVRIDVSK